MDIKSIGVVGAGQMGNGIAHVMALAGYDVRLNDISEEALDAAMALIATNLDRQVSREKITSDERDAALAQGIAEFPDQRDRMTESLAEALTDFEQYGYCTSFGAWKPEINAIAAPIRSLDGSSVYGLNAGGPSFLVSGEELHRTSGPRLLRAVAELGGT